jgi:hypothetical protein
MTTSISSQNTGIDGVRVALGSAQQEVGGIRVALGSAQQEVGGIRAEMRDAPQFALRFRATGGAERGLDEIDEKIKSAAGAIFQKTKDLIVESLGLGRGVDTNIEINYTTQIATCIDQSGNKSYVDLTNPTLTNRDQIKKSMQEFMVAVSKYRPHAGDRLSEYKPMIAGPISGKSFFAQGVNGMGSSLEQFAKKDLRKLMQKGNPGLENDSNAINQKMKDMATVDLYKENLVKALKKQIQDLENDMRTPPFINLPKIALEDNKRDLKILKGICRALEGSHNEALYAYIALEGFDSVSSKPTSGSSIEKAKKVEQNLRSYLVEDQRIDRKWGGLKRKEGGLEANDDLFIKGVGALVLPAAYTDVNGRVLFNEYLESQTVHSDYGTGMEGSFLALKALFHHNGLPALNHDRADEINTLILADFKNSSINQALKSAIEATQSSVNQLHSRMDQEVSKGLDPEVLIKANIALIKNAA